MSDYTYQDILRMQEEAKARVMEMRRRSRFLTEGYPPEQTGGPSGDPPQRRCETPSEHAAAIRMPVELPGEASPQTGGGAGKPFRQTVPDPERTDAAGTKNAARGRIGLPTALRNVFGSLGEEETEKMFILALCLLLSQENGDEGLMLALMYLLT